LEHYGKFKKAKNTWLQKQKQHVKNVVKKPQRRQDKEQGGQDSVGERSRSGDQGSDDGQWRRDILHGRNFSKGKEMVRPEESADAASLKENAESLDLSNAQDVAKKGVAVESGVIREEHISHRHSEERAGEPEKREEEVQPIPSYDLQTNGNLQRDASPEGGKPSSDYGGGGMDGSI